MPRAARPWSVALVLALAAVALADDDVDPKVVKEAGTTLEKFAKDLEKLKADDFKKAGDAMARKYSLEQVMHNLSPRSKHGLGVGAKAGAIKPDGIELKLDDLSKAELTPAKVTAERPALTQMARFTGALGRVLPSFPPPDATPPPPPGSWEKFSKALQKGSEEFEAALKKGDPKTIRTAATNLNASCVECHRVYR